MNIVRKIYVLTLKKYTSGKKLLGNQSFWKLSARFTLYDVVAFFFPETLYIESIIYEKRQSTYDEKHKLSELIKKAFMKDFWKWVEFEVNFLFYRV